MSAAEVLANDWRVDMLSFHELGEQALASSRSFSDCRKFGEIGYSSNLICTALSTIFDKLGSNVVSIFVSAIGLACY